MNSLARRYQAFIILFSEAIWIYYIVILFTNVEWEQPAVLAWEWWVLAALGGRFLTGVFRHRVHIVILTIITAGCLAVIVVKNWMDTVPQGAYFFGIVVSIALCFIYLRSAHLVEQLPKRQAVIRRFEVNVVLYVFLAWVFTVNHWGGAAFHISFIMAIVGTLLSMAFMIESHGEEGTRPVQIQQVGKSGWFTGFIVTILLCLPLVSFLLLVPGVSRFFIFIVNGIWDMLKSLAGALLQFINWLFQFIPTSDVELDPTPILPAEGIGESTAIEENPIGFPVEWVLGGAALIAAAGLIILMIYVLKTRRVSKSLPVKKISVSKEAWWPQLLNRWRLFINRIKILWRQRFPNYYDHLIYWHFQRLKRWGAKNGLPQKMNETSLEYVHRLINLIPQQNDHFMYDDKEYQLSILLLRLNEDFQSTYYGRGKSQSGIIDKDYIALHHQLKKLRISKRDMMSER